MADKIFHFRVNMGNAVGDACEGCVVCVCVCVCVCACMHACVCVCLVSASAWHVSQCSGCGTPR